MSGDGNLPESEKISVTKQRSNTASITEQQSHIDTTSASLQGRPRPLVKKNTGTSEILAFFQVFRLFKHVIANYTSLLFLQIHFFSCLRNNVNVWINFFTFVILL